jgi:hypothetical protein
MCGRRKEAFIGAALRSLAASRLRFPRPIFPGRRRPGFRTQFCSGGLAAAADQVWQIWNDRLARNAEPVAKVVPKSDAEFGGGAHQSEECVAAVAALRVPPLILRLVTWRRTSGSEPLVWSGISR